MHCPFHVATEMVFEPRVDHGRRLRRKGPTINDVDLSFDMRSRLGIFRCPVPHCAQVAAPEYVAPEAKLCPRCGEKSDATKERQRHRDYTCINCMRIRNGYWERLREKRAARYAATGK
jgi:hypothetical protein